MQGETKYCINSNVAFCGKCPFNVYTKSAFGMNRAEFAGDNRNEFIAENNFCTLKSTEYTRKSNGSHSCRVKSVHFYTK